MVIKDAGPAITRAHGVHELEYFPPGNHAADKYHPAPRRMQLSHNEYGYSEDSGKTAKALH
jgi:hypothetical protein